MSPHLGVPNARWVSLAIVAAVLAVVIFCDLPGGGRFIDVLQNSAHAPAFGLVSLLLLKTFRRADPRPTLFWYALAWTAAVFLGAMVELVQALVGRDADLHDVFNDGVGAACALAAHRFLSLRQTTSRKWAPLALALVSLAIAAWPLTECAAAYALRAHRFPDLLVLKSRLDFYFATTDVDDTDRRVANSLPLWSNVEHSITVELTGTEWPGVRLVGVKSDWSAYRVLLIDIENPGAQALPLTVRLDDDTSVKNDAPCYVDVELPPHTRKRVSLQLDSLPVAKSGEKIDLRQMRKFSLFHEGPSESQLTVHSVRLTK